MIRVYFRAAEGKSASEWQKARFSVKDGLVYVLEDADNGRILAVYPIEVVCAVEEAGEAGEADKPKEERKE